MWGRFMNRVPLVIGQVYGRLTVLSEAPKFIKAGATTRREWFASTRCTCGVEKDIRSQTIRNGMSKSCGCSNYEVACKDSRVRTIEHVMRYSKSSAKKRRIEFHLTFEQVAAVIFLPCSYCGAPPCTKSQRQITARKYGDPIEPYSGMDRVDPSMGYIPENIVPCCWECNTAKLAKTHDGFVDYIRRVAAHLSLIPAGAL